MEIILLGIYAFFVWLIFIKLKLLPWTTPWKVGVAIFPVVAMAAMLLLLNIFAPTTTDVRVVKYVVPIVSQVQGTRDRSAGREQPAGEEGGRAVQDRSDARTRSRFGRSKRNWCRTRRRSAPIRPG